MNTDWMNREELSSIAPEKKAMLVEFMQAIQGKSMQQAMPVYMRMQKTMKEKNLQLSPEETQLMIRLLKENMTETEKQQWNHILKRMGKA